MFRQDKRLRNRKDMPNQSFAMETIGWFIGQAKLVDRPAS